jgi:hypothetical protein
LIKGRISQYQFNDSILVAISYHLKRQLLIRIHG